MNVAFIINSQSRKADKLISEIREHPHSLLRNALIHQTEYKGHGFDIARDIAESIDILISVGGDGTLHEVVNGIMNSTPEVENRPVIGLIPNGSANDFARVQRIPMDLDWIVKAIEHNSVRKIDIGRIHFKSGNQVHYFINVADSGIGAEVVQKLEKHSIFKKITSSDIKFAAAILQTFISYKRKPVEITIDQDSLLKSNILTLIVANSSSFGSGLMIAPDAKINDGKFQILVGNISLWGYLMSIGKLKRGEKLTLKGVRYFNASRVSISGTQDLFTEADGELVGSGDLEIDCLPNAIRFLLPD